MAAPETLLRDMFGLTVGDPTTIADALEIVGRYQLELPLRCVPRSTVPPPKA